MRRNLVASLLEHGEIETTLQKAKAVQPMAEKLITLAKKGDLAARRRAIAILRDRIMCDDEEKVTRNRYGEVVKGPRLIKHLFESVAPQFADRKGGYTRIVKTSRHRIGDGASLVRLALVRGETGPEIGGVKSKRRTQGAKRESFAKKAMEKSKAVAAKA